MQFEVVDNETDYALLALKGRLDSESVNRIETQFNAWTVAQKKHAIVDFSEVSFLASMGLRMLIAAGRPIKRQGHRLILVAPQDMVTEVITRSGILLDGIVTIVANREEALAKLAEKPK